MVEIAICIEQPLQVVLHGNKDKIAWFLWTDWLSVFKLPFNFFRFVDMLQRQQNFRDIRIWLTTKFLLTIEFCFTCMYDKTKQYWRNIWQVWRMKKQFPSSHIMISIIEAELWNNVNAFNYFTPYTVWHKGRLLNDSR